MKKSLLTLLILLGCLFASHAKAAITADASASKVVNGFNAGLTTTWSHTTGSGATLMVLTCMVWQDVPGAGTITAASYNSVALTTATSTRGGGMYSWIGYLASPTSGTNTVSVTVTGNLDAFKCGSQTFFDTATASPLDASDVGSGSVTTISKAITTVTNNDLVIASVSHFGTQTLTIGGSQSSIYNDVTGSTGGAGGYRIVTTAGSYTPSWTTTGSNDWSISVAPFKPAATATRRRFPGFAR